MKNLLGGKGANLAEMFRQARYARASWLHDHHRRLHPLLRPLEHQRDVYPEAARKPAEVESGIGSWLHHHHRSSNATMEASSAKFPSNPLLVSVRSGARASMPGMMDTVLNLGLNDTTVQGLIKADRQRALRLRLLPSLRADVRRRRAGVSRPKTKDEEDPFEALLDEAKKKARGVERRHRADRRGSQGARRRVQGRHQA
jgi:pyruvate,orthophosphate dikinase